MISQGVPKRSIGRRSMALGLLRERVRSVGVVAVLGLAMGAGAAVPAHLPGELPAGEILDGKYPWPASPKVEVGVDEIGMAKARLGKTPPPGVHPRILLSPEELPDLRRRLTETRAGREMMATLRERVNGSLRKPGAWENEVFELLAAGDTGAALKILGEKRRPSFAEGHYQPGIPYAMVLEAFDAMVSQDAERGRKVAAAIAGWAKAVEPTVDAVNQSPLNDDVWRAKISGPQTGSAESDQGARNLMAYHLMGYAYDFGFNFMDEAQRSQVRRVIAKATNGKVWLGARLPQHMRNWNWVAVGLSQPLLALAIEGEEGYDPRVYKLGVEIARDYLTYGFSADGSSTEAVGYTQFGFVWGMPFMVAATRRGEPLLQHARHRATLDWYLHTLEPSGGAWQSHGDGGDRGPDFHTMHMWRWFFPDDPRVKVLWAEWLDSIGGRPHSGRFHIIEPLIFADDYDVPAGPSTRPSALQLPTTWHDEERGSFYARSGWGENDALMRFECRIDSHGPSHEHADRGTFTFSALGRTWAREFFRSIESRHHNVVLVDGKGQGYWPGPGRWVGNTDAGWAVMAACDAKDAYDWWWPKSILADGPDAERFKFARWASYAKEAEQFRKDHAGTPIERDTRPAVVSFWKGFEAHDPRLWDEDGWPVRLPHNPVEKAYRTVVMVKSPRPYMIVVDDIRKDDRERLYEWLMLPGTNTELASIRDDELVLADATHPRDPATGLMRLPGNARRLLVRVLDAAETTQAADLSARPSIRLESFEQKDTTTADGRSFGLGKRLVIPSRSVEPGFKVLLFPATRAEDLPKTAWNADHTQLTVTHGDTTDTFTFTKGPDGRTRISASRPNAAELKPIQ